MKTRIVTGVIGAAVFLSLICAGGLWTKGLMLILAIIGYYELMKMAKANFGDPLMFGGLIAIALLFYNSKDMGDTLLILMLYALVSLAFRHATMEQASLSVMGLLYVGFGFYSFWDFYDSNGLSSILFLLFCIWATDSGAYFIGKTWGKRKIAPEVSPNKTIEGTIGGVLCAMFVGVLWVFAWDANLVVLFIATAISVMGQIGDLAESAIKRHFGIKDSSSLFPGHGGVLDRFDSVLFVCLFLQVAQVTGLDKL